MFCACNLNLEWWLLLQAYLLESRLSRLEINDMSPKWRVKNNRTRPNTSKQIKGGKHTLHNIAGGILPLASHLSLEKAIHWGMSETFGHKMAGNCFRKFGWYLKSSIHGHPNKKKKNSKEWILLCSTAVLTLTSSYVRLGFNHQATGTCTLNSDRSGSYCSQF